MPRPRNDEQRERFARAYVASFNVAEAARRAGCTPQHGWNMLQEPEVSARIRELNDAMLKASDITAQRVMLELGRLAFADVREVYSETGELLSVHEMSDDAASTIAGIESDEHSEYVVRPVIDPDTGEQMMDLITGEPMTQRVRIKIVTRKVKRYDKVGPLSILAKHFKLVGDEGDGVNALASALADRLKTARKRTTGE